MWLIFAKLFWISLSIVLGCLILFVIDKFIKPDQSLFSSTFEMSGDPFDLIRDREYILNCFFFLLTNPLCIIFGWSFIVLNMCILVISWPFFFCEFISQLVKCIVSIKAKREIRFNHDLRIEFFPTWADLLRLIFLRQPRFLARVVVYSILKKRKMGGGVVVFPFLVQRLFIWLFSSPVWVLSKAFSFGVCVNSAIKKFNIKWFFTETLLFDLNSFVITKLSHNRSTCSSLKIYWKNDNIVFNPGSSQSSKIIRDTCAHRAKNIDHIYLGSVDNPFGLTGTSHIPEHAKILLTRGSGGSGFVFNQLAHASVKHNNMTRIAHLHEKTGINDPLYYQKIVNICKFNRMSLNNCGLLADGYGRKSVLEKDGNFFNNILSHKDYINDVGVTIKAEIAFNVLDSMTAEERDFFRSSGIILNSYYDVNHNSPMIKNISDNRYLKLYNKENFKDELTRSSQLIHENHYSLSNNKIENIKTFNLYFPD